MVTILEALAEYNKQRGTNFITVASLGAYLAKEALKEAWMAKERNTAHEKAVINTMGF